MGPIRRNQARNRENVDLVSRPETPNGVVHVRGDGKSDAAIRSVPLTPRAQDVLQRRWKAAEAGMKQSPYVFPGSGNTGHIISLQHPHEQAIKKAKLKGFEFYCWRHTFGTRAAMAGMDKFSLARLMGHSSPSVAERYYIHTVPEHIAAGFEKFVAYSERGIAEAIAAAFPEATRSNDMYHPMYHGERFWVLMSARKGKMAGSAEPHATSRFRCF